MFSYLSKGETFFILDLTTFFWTTIGFGCGQKLWTLTDRRTKEFSSRSVVRLVKWRNSSVFCIFVSFRLSTGLSRSVCVFDGHVNVKGMTGTDASDRQTYSTSSKADAQTSNSPTIITFCACVSSRRTEYLGKSKWNLKIKMMMKKTDTRNENGKAWKREWSESWTWWRWIEQHRRSSPGGRGHRKWRVETRLFWVVEQVKGPLRMVRTSVQKKGRRPGSEIGNEREKWRRKAREGKRRQEKEREGKRRWTGLMCCPESCATLK